MVTKVAECLDKLTRMGFVEITCAGGGGGGGGGGGISMAIQFSAACSATAWYGRDHLYNLRWQIKGIKYTR